MQKSSFKMCRFTRTLTGICDDAAYSVGRRAYEESAIGCISKEGYVASAFVLISEQVARFQGGLLFRRQELPLKDVKKSGFAFFPTPPNCSTIFIAQKPGSTFALHAVVLHGKFAQCSTATFDILNQNSRGRHSQSALVWAAQAPALLAAERHEQRQQQHQRTEHE